jgi:hypothetical protein
MEVSMARALKCVAVRRRDALPRACRQHDDGDPFRAVVSFQSGNELDTVHVTREKKARHDDIGFWGNPQSIASGRYGNGQQSLIAEKLRIHLSAVSLRLNEQNDGSRRWRHGVFLERVIPRGKVDAKAVVAWSPGN